MPGPPMGTPSVLESCQIANVSLLTSDIALDLSLLTGEKSELKG